jgi:hypothetical protein
MALVLAMLALVGGGLTAMTAAGQGGANVIQNGDFSAALNGDGSIPDWAWTFVTQNPTSGCVLQQGSGSACNGPYVNVYTTMGCDPLATGTPFLALDTPDGSDGYVEQQVTVPASGGTLTFESWGNLDPTTATIGVATSSARDATTVLSFAPPPVQTATAGVCTGATPANESVSLSAYAGRTVYLRVEATGPGYDGTYADFDDFSLTPGTSTTTTTAPTTTTNTTPTPPGKRASATAVVCDFTFADETDSCTATVGDATGKAAQPTGTVTFTSTIPGTSFTGGGKCTLAPQTGDVGVTSCSVSYQGDQTQSLQASAAYSGDTTFAPSSGSTQSAVPSDGNSVYDPTIQSFNPPTVNGGPATLDVSVDNPVTGTTIDATGQVTENLTQGAVCTVAQDEDQQPGGEGAAARAARARTKAKKPKTAPSVTVHVVKRRAGKGKIRLVLRFDRRRLLKAFPHTMRLQVVVVVKLTPPHGLALTTFHRETITLRVKRTRRRAGRPGAVGRDAAVTAVAITWSGTNCGTVTVSTNFSTTSNETSQPMRLNWTDAVATCFGATQGALVTLKNITGQPLNGTLGSGGISVAVNAADGQGLNLRVQGTFNPARGGTGSLHGGYLMIYADGTTCTALPPATLAQTQWDPQSG